jgi:Group II intron, maturase-specific domain
MSLSSHVAQEDTGRLAGRKGPAKLRPGLVRCGRITPIIILGAFKGIGCSRRGALLWNRQASIILDLILSVCVFAACGGKASAQSHHASSTGFADRAMKLGEDPLLKLRDTTSARYSAKALPEMIGELNRHLEVWANYHQLGHPRTTFRKVNRYGRHRLQRHPRWRSHGPRYVTGPSLIGRNAALSGGPGRYPWRHGIITTIFWIGERPRGNNPVPNARSSWDRYWYYSYGGYDNPDPGSRRNFIPINFVPRQNPFYLALPYNDVEGGHTKYEASQVIPWFKQAFVRDGQTVLKDRWIAVQHGNKVCYAQWEDCGPFRTDDWRYVFGNERPRPNLNQGAGLDVSPAVRDYLGLGVKDACDWKFVEYREVPPGPWATYGDNNTFVILRRQSNKQFASK